MSETLDPKYLCVETLTEEGETPGTHVHRSCPNIRLGLERPYNGAYVRGVAISERCYSHEPHRCRGGYGCRRLKVEGKGFCRYHLMGEAKRLKKEQAEKERREQERMTGNRSVRVVTKRALLVCPDCNVLIEEVNQVRFNEIKAAGAAALTCPHCEERFRIYAYRDF